MATFCPSAAVPHLPPLLLLFAALWLFICSLHFFFYNPLITLLLFPILKCILSRWMFYLRHKAEGLLRKKASHILLLYVTRQTWSKLSTWLIYFWSAIVKNLEHCTKAPAMEMRNTGKQNEYSRALAGRFFERNFHREWRLYRFILPRRKGKKMNIASRLTRLHEGTEEKL